MYLLRVISQVFLVQTIIQNSIKRYKHRKLHSQKLTWIPKIAIFERRYILKTIILGIYVRFRGGTSFQKAFAESLFASSDFQRCFSRKKIHQFEPTCQGSCASVMDTGATICLYVDQTCCILVGKNDHSTRVDR